MEDPFREDENKAARKAQEELARQRYEKIMATKDGRWVMWVFLNGLQTFSPVRGEMLCGMQSGGMAIRDTLKSANLELYHMMIVENDR